MRNVFYCLVLSLVAGSSVFAQNIEGDWQGTLNAGPQQLRLVLHVAKAGEGLTATVDSIDQGARGIPVNSIKLSGSALQFAMETIGGAYRGKVSPDGSSIAGTWTQSGGSLALTFTRLPAAAAKRKKTVKPSDIDGDWEGALDAGGQKLRLVLHIVNEEDGLTATMDSLDQNAMGMPVTTISQNRKTLKFEMKALGASFEGALNPALTTVSGTFSQAGAKMPLVLNRMSKGAPAKKAEVLRRPQNPAKPYPYREEEVSYDNRAAPGVKLAGTLTLPSGEGHFPAALLITGSGPQDRDESLLGHRPFLVLADYLTRSGIAVLRVDDRGVGESTGNFEAATSIDFASDAEAGIAYLKTRKEIDPKKIGLVGHSEGGMIAPIVANRSSDVAFIVMMAGIGVNGEELLVSQMRLISKSQGISDEQIDKNATLERRLFAMVREEKDDATLQRKARKLIPVSMGPPGMVEVQLKMMASPWFRYFIDFDPVPVLKKVKCPVLAINGENDLQVPPSQNLAAIQKALESGGNSDFQIVKLPKLNHLFQTSQTGAITEYSRIEETIAPAALELIAGWITKHTKI